MGLLEKLIADMKTAMKAKNQFRVNTLRLIIAQIKNVRIDSKKDLTPEQELAILTNAIKKRNEAIEIYQKTDRTDLLEKEQKELAIISEYLPEQMSEEEVNRIVSEIVERLAATNLKDLGRVMAEAMKTLKGKADGKQVQQLVRSKLA